MSNLTPKETVLKRIRQALVERTPNKFPDVDLDTQVYVSPTDLITDFAAQFTQIAGQFVYCANRFDALDQILTLVEERRWTHLFCWEEELLGQLRDIALPVKSTQRELEHVEAALTTCEALIARTGTILLSSRRNSRALTVYPPVHLVWATRKQLVAELKDGLTLVRNRYGANIPSVLTYVSGPSRTADIEKTLVLGAHGPKELMVFYIDEPDTEF